LTQAHEPRRPRRLCRRAALGLLAAALLGGCGLPEYEARMQQEQERLDRFDEENKALDAPLDPPKRQAGKDTVQDPVFFRPPKGIAATPKEPALGPLSRYLRNSQNCPFSEVHLATAPADQKDFASSVVKAASAQLGGDASPRRVSKNPYRRDPLQFEVYDNAPGGYALYLCQRNGVQVAVGFQADRGRALSSLAKQIDLSLESLAAGPEANRLKKDWVVQLKYRGR
jgi:hypothetical protein